MKLLGVEAARGIAALLVVLLHASAMLEGPGDYSGPAFGGLFMFGRAGVDFFFVLSGFIITYVHYRDIGRPAALGTFWRKRLRRIYPTYWAVLAGFGCLLAVSPTPGLAERDLGHVIASVLLWPETAEPILGVAWSLRHEMVFYALFSLAIIDRRLGTVVLGAWGALILFNMGWAMATGRPYFGGVAGMVLVRGFNIQFFFGMGVAWLVRTRPPRLARDALIAGLILFFGTGLAESFGPVVQHEWPPRHLAYALGAALTLYGLATLDRARALRVPGPLLELGSASYSLYLVHPVALILMHQALRHARPWFDPPLEIAYLILVGSAVVAGVAFSRVVERPLMRWGTDVRAVAPKGAGPKVEGGEAG